MSNGFLAEIQTRQLPASTTPELAPGELRLRTDPAAFPFETTAELEPPAARAAGSADAARPRRSWSV